MNEKNTVNVCLGHLPFPHSHAENIDLMISPRLMNGPKNIAVVDDGAFGENGSALSEYVQLLWLLEHLDVVSVGCSYVRVFQYRRFVSRNQPVVGQRSSNLPWSTTVGEGDLGAFRSEFDRFSDSEIFNTPVQFNGGMLGQYACDHVLEDILNFTNFLIETGVLSSTDAAEFLRESVVVPSCNIGVFRLETYRSIFSTLRIAASFVHSRYFIARTGGQRRSVGFLLERLNSHLIFRMIRQNLVKANFGYNITISNDSVVTVGGYNTALDDAGSMS